jgi:hypothetical protein
MVRISISPAAFDAIAATLPGNVGVENKRNAEGNWLSWLGRRILDKLNAIREPHEGLSDVILRVAEETKPVQRISLRKARPGKTLATPCGRSNLRSNR